MTFGHTGDSENLINKIKIFFAELHNIAATVGTLIIGFGYKLLPKIDHKDIKTTLFTSESIPGGVIIFIGLALVIFGLVGAYKDKKTLKEENKELLKSKFNLEESERQVESLKSRLEKLNKALAQSWLIKLNTDLGLDTNDRVTIYYHNNDRFYLLARYSDNPEFRKIHRTKFQLNKGVISRVWQHDEHEEVDCPKFEDSSPNGYMGYMSATYNYDTNKLDSLHMKSHRMYGKGINNQNNRLGAILVESTRCAIITEELKNKMRTFCTTYETHLSSILNDGVKYDREIEAVRKPNRNSDVDSIIMEKVGVKNEKVS